MKKSKRTHPWVIWCKNLRSLFGRDDVGRVSRHKRYKTEKAAEEALKALQHQNHWSYGYFEYWIEREK